MTIPAKISTVLGICCIVYGILLVVSGILNGSALLFGLLGTFLLLLPRFYPVIAQHSQEGILRWIRVSIVGLTILFFAMCTLTALVIFQAGRHNPQKEPDAILVLGAGLRGDTVSLSLKQRLDTAYEYALQHPQAVIVVSGGQGPGEWVTESSAMKQYLMEKGIDESQILEENRSTNTQENFYYSAEILSSIFPSGYQLVFVSNNFHIYRSGQIAAGLQIEAEGLGAPSLLYLYPSHYIREIAAVYKYNLTALFNL